MAPMYIDIVPNRNSPPAVLLRESWREGKKTHKRTVANLTGLPEEAIDALRRSLKGERLVPAESVFAIERSLPHGHVAAVVGTLRGIGLDAVLGSRASRERDLVVAMVAARILSPGSKLATARGLDADSATSTLAEELGVEDASAEDLYAAMDWLLERQPRIEKKLAARHLSEGTLLLYDVSSSYFEGRKCPLAKFGHSRDDKPGKLQIVFGLLCAPDGCPVAVEVFPGNTSDPATLASAIATVRERFGLQRVVLVADRGLITESRIKAELRPVDGLEWISALRSPAVKALVESGDLQLSLFDDRDLAEITSADFPGERLIVCRNPLLAADRARTRQELLAVTEAKLEAIRVAVERDRSPLSGSDAIGVRLGRVLERSKMGKHFICQITDTGFTYERNEPSIKREAALDGFYVVRTTVEADEMDASEVVAAYKSLAQIERAFRSTKTVDLEIRPIHHRTEPRVRAHVFICMLAYYVEWHVRQALAPILHDDHDREAARAARRSIVAPSEISERAKSKKQTRRTEDGLPVQSFQSLLAHLATLTKNRVRATAAVTFDQLAAPTPLQQRAFDLLGVSCR
jgi:hypothetical protein